MLKFSLQIPVLFFHILNAFQLATDDQGNFTYPSNSSYTDQNSTNLDSFAVEGRSPPDLEHVFITRSRVFLPLAGPACLATLSTNTENLQV